VLKGTTPELYKNSALFFANIHPTCGLKDCIKVVAGQITNQWVLTLVCSHAAKSRGHGA